MSKEKKDRADDCVALLIPGGRTARVPLAELERYVTQDAQVSHQPSNDDVTAHSMSVDATTGTSEWHTDWEYGQCDYTDEAGFPQQLDAWHRHPFGTEYSELYEG